MSDEIDMDFIRAATGVVDMAQPFGAGKEPGEQQSVEWLMERCGYCTASRFKDATDFLKNGKPGAKRTAYMWELVYERVAGKPMAHFTSAAMERGTALEPHARAAYEARTGAFVMQTGFRKHPTIPWIGGSPDGVIEPSGGWEAKCPVNPQQHLACFLEGMPPEHMAQVQGLIWLHDAEWWDFSSYQPDLPAPLDLYVQRIERDAEYVQNLEIQLIAFLSEVAELEARIRQATSSAPSQTTPAPSPLPEATGADSPTEAA